LFGSARICSKHFSDACFTKPLQQQLLGYSPSKARKLRPDAIPTLHLSAVSPLVLNDCLSTVETFNEVMAPPALNEDSSTTKTFDEVMASPALNEDSATTKTFDEVMAPPALNEDSSTTKTFDKVMALPALMEVPARWSG